MKKWVFHENYVFSILCNHHSEINDRISDKHFLSTENKKRMCLFDTPSHVINNKVTL